MMLLKVRGTGDAALDSSTALDVDSTVATDGDEPAIPGATRAGAPVLQGALVSVVGRRATAAGRASWRRAACR